MGLPVKVAGALLYTSFTLVDTCRSVLKITTYRLYIVGYNFKICKTKFEGLTHSMYTAQRPTKTDYCSGKVNRFYIIKKKKNVS